MYPKEKVLEEFSDKQFKKYDCNKYVQTQRRLR